MERFTISTYSDIARAVSRGGSYRSRPLAPDAPSVLSRAERGERTSADELDADGHHPSARWSSGSHSIGKVSGHRRLQPGRSDGVIGQPNRWAYGCPQIRQVSSFIRSRRIATNSAITGAGDGRNRLSFVTRDPLLAIPETSHSIAFPSFVGAEANATASPFFRAGRRVGRPPNEIRASHTERGKSKVSETYSRSPDARRALSLLANMSSRMTFESLRVCTNQKSPSMGAPLCEPVAV